MSKKKPTINEVTREEEEFTYRATLDVGDTHLATITLRATDDEDAKKQLKAAMPPYYEGVGGWKLTKTEAREVTL